MKAINSIRLALLMLAFSISVSYAQTDYKGHKIDASGKITDKDGKHVGSLTKEGIVSDASGEKVAHVDANGFFIDAKTGKSLGKVGKNGSFIPYSASPAESWTIGSPEDGVCLVKDKDGNVKAEVHETYKHVGACAIHCLTHHMIHSEVLNENASANYVCPMHSDVTSDKEGKCSKCGMALVKKKKK